MPQTLSLSNSCVNPYTEVKITNKFLKDDGSLMCFGEFICTETGKYLQTIVNGNTDEGELILQVIEPGTIVHTMEPMVNTQAKRKNYTKHRAYMRIIDEQPIYIQDLYKCYANRVSADKDVAVVIHETKEEATQDQNQKTPEKSKQMPNRIGLAKTALRHRYIDRLTTVSPHSQSSSNRHANTLGDLVDYCIEHNINPYQHES